MRFRRGDTNSDKVVDLSDGIFTLNFLFLGGESPECADALDTDESGALDISDGIFLFNYLFLGGGRPDAPGPQSCGQDPTAEDDVDCAAYSPSCD